MQRIVFAALLIGGLAGTAKAGVVLCAKPKKDGTFAAAVKIRTGTCTRDEVLLDPSTLGLQGPPGPTGPPGWERPCPPDSVRVGPVCVDTYEASLWATSDASVIDEIQAGTVTLAELQGAATQYQAADGSGPPFVPFGTVLYAVSLAGVQPSHSTSGWLTAELACRNSHKRLPTSAEWQAAALGTPVDQCFGATGDAVGPTGDRSGCVSTFGAHDMFGNLVWEWTEDLVEMATGCTFNFSTPFGPASSCFGGNGSIHDEAHVVRGGHRSDLPFPANVYTMITDEFFFDADDTGFRCVR